MKFSVRFLVKDLFTFDRKKDEFNPTNAQIFIRIVLGLLCAAWFSFFPIYLLVIHMYESEFFSYDIFVDGIFGIKSFIYVFMLLLTVLSIVLYSPLFQLKYWVTEKSKDKKRRHSLSLRSGFYGVFALSIIFHISCFYFFIKDLASFLWVEIFCCVIASYFLMMVGNSWKHNLFNWKPLCMLMMFTIVFPVYNSQVTSTMVGKSLSNFRVGGDRYVEVSLAHEKNIKSEKNIITGKLFLLSPSMIYIKNSKGELDVLRISELAKVNIK